MNASKLRTRLQAYLVAIANKDSRFRDAMQAAAELETDSEFEQKLDALDPTEVAAAMDYRGAWNASTNIPALADGTGDSGDMYKVSVAGTRNLGSGSIAFKVGDLVIYSGSVWEQISAADTVPYAQTRFVDLSGDDTTGDGSTDRPFRSYAAAGASIPDASSSKLYAIKALGAGDFVEDSLVFAPWIVYSGIASDFGTVSIRRTDGKAVPSATTTGDYFLSSILMKTGFDFYLSASGSRIWLNNVRFHGLQESTLLTCVPDVSDSLAGKYITLDGPLYSWYIWFSTGNGTIGTDPALAGRIGYKASIATNATAADVVAAISSILSSTPQSLLILQDFNFDFFYTGPVNADQIPILCTQSFNVAPLGVGTSGFTAAISRIGTGSRVGTSSGTVGLQMRNCSSGVLDLTGSSLKLERTASAFLYETTILHGLLCEGPSSGAVSNAIVSRSRIQNTRMKGRFNLTNINSQLAGFNNGVTVSGTSGGNPQTQMPFDTRNTFAQATGVSMVSGTNVLTGLGFKIPEGNHVIGDGIPANTTVLNSRDLAGNDVRISANATKTQTTTISYRFVLFQSGALPTQVGFGGSSQAEALSGLLYTPVTSSNWNVPPTQVRHALDQLGSRVLTKESYTLLAGDIVSGYADLTKKYKPGSVEARVRPVAAPATFVLGDEGTEYTMSTYVDASGITKSRITLAGNWAASLLAGDVIKIHGTVESDELN
jgi:hypothetical protein